MNPMDEFFNTDQEGHLTKTDEACKKDDELPRLDDPSTASKFRPMEHIVETLDDDGDVLVDGLNTIIGTQQAEDPRPKA